jgi:deoxyribodipyrimidine photo-lyase
MKKPTPPTTPTSRVRALRDQPVNPDGDYALCWLTTARRPFYNGNLAQAAAYARAHNKPLLVLEALRCDYPWASARTHRFILDGMAAQARYFAPRAADGIYYIAYVEPSPEASRGLLAALSQRAVVTVGDDYPAFFLPQTLASAARHVTGRLEVVDSNGLLPMRAAPHAFKRAFDLRRFLKEALWVHLSPDVTLAPEPLRGLTLPPLSPRATQQLAEVTSRWPMATQALLHGQRLADVQGLDQQVAPVPHKHGGWQAAHALLDAFITQRLPRYADDRNHPDADATSGLSPYLHFGHLSPHAILAAVAQAEGGWEPAWAQAAISTDKDAKRAQRAARRAAADAPPTPTTDASGHEGGGGAGWWGMSHSAGGFMDELVTWRELGFNACAFDPAYDQYEALPAWARQTLADHAADPRPHLYSVDQLAAAATDDPLWNAAQRQLAREGVIHGYLRMLWGKRALSWFASPQEAFHALIHLNNRYALDGRDPNSYSGIRWVFGQYDRAWGPERPIYGKVRYMTSDSAQHKLRLKQYTARFRA